MKLLTQILICLIAIEHLYILYIEMFAWETKGKKVFKTIPENMFKQTKTFAANQGLYNVFLAAGLFWSVFIPNKEWSFYISLYFLSCVIIAGCYGALTASKSIFIKQALPAIITIIILLFSYYI